MWILLLTLFSFSPARAQVEAGHDLMMIVEPSCWAAQSTLQQRIALNLGARVQHKSLPAPQGWMAVSVHAERGMSAAEVKALSANPCVQRLAENPHFQIAGQPDPRQSEQSGLIPIGQMDAEKIFYHPLFGIRNNVTVGVVDTGIQLDHPDLVGHIWRDASGEAGFDFVNGDDDPSDDNGHGTHVAGIVGAQRDNGVGIRGVMGDLVRLMAVKTQGSDGGGLLADLINGIKYAADNGADVINLSLAGTMQSDLLEGALQYAIDKGSFVVVAAGNDGVQITPTALVVPAGYSPAHPGMMAVGAFDALDLTRSVFSNYGTNYVQISAPGSAGTTGGILSTFKDSRYLALNGTSQASPMVAGAAALAVGFMKTRGLSVTPAQLQAWIQTSAIADPNLASSFQNGRRLSLPRLGTLLLQSTVIDSTGGFDAP